jgi:hypothetical protein
VLNITIHNQYPGLELASPVCFSNGTTHHVSPNRQVDIDTAMKASFGMDSEQKDFKGALLYKLQRKYADRDDSCPNDSARSVKDIETNMYLLVTWDIESHNHEFCVCLIECPANITWDEDKLWILYKEYDYQFCKYYQSGIITWLMYDGAVIETRFNIKYGPDYKLDINISEGTNKYDAREPVKTGLKRLVLSWSMLIMLIYAVRLTITLSFKLNIHNQCMNANLVSPTYITGIELECYRPPDHKVCAGDTMQSGFIIKFSDAPYGVLIYRLQRRQTHESTEISEDTSSTIQLLVIWKFSKSKTLHADVLLIEHDEGFNWNEDDLRKLRRKNINRLSLLSDSATDTWTLDDNVALMTTFKIMNEDRILNINISEVKRDSDTRTPAHIDLEW